MSEVDPLEAALARARAPSTFVESRPFTLSREKAIEKQREFALRHPSQVVLELVQGAVFAGATAIAVETHPDRLMVAWVGGRPFAEEELEGWVDHLFADRTDAGMRPMVQLATGLNALLQRGPRGLSVETGDGRRAFRLDLDGEGNGRIGEVDDGLEATFVLARFRRNLWERLTGPAITEELRLIEERCLYTPVPIYLNGRAPFGYRPTRHIEIFGADRQVHFDHGHRRGVVATHLHSRAATGFRAVVGGVWITTLPLPELRAPALLGVLCDDDLRKTADHADIVQDRRYVELLHAVQPYATKLLQEDDDGYAPPPLPALDERPAAAAAEVEARPLPDELPSLPGRRAVPVERLDGHPGPLFVVDPADRERLSGDRMGVDRFPWTVLVLDEGRRLSLARRLPQVTLHRLMAPSDAEFVRRALDRERRLREVETVASDGARVRLVHHRDGALPDAGTGKVGWPYQVRGPEGLVDAGVLTDGQALSSLVAGEAVRPFPLPVQLDHVQLFVEGDVGRLEPQHVEAALDAAQGLVADDGDAPLLGQLLGAMAVPVPREGGLELSLPAGWPEALLDRPIAGGVSARDLLDDVVEDRVRAVDDPTLAALGPLARRLGAGHLAAPVLERCVLGVGRIGDSWVWLEGASMWTLTAVTAFCAVYGHQGAPQVPSGWTAMPSEGPPLVAWHRNDVAPVDLAGGWRLLERRLGRLLDDREGWGIHVRPGIDVPHLEGLARVARARLSQDPLVPTSFDEVRVLRGRGRDVALPADPDAEGDWVLRLPVRFGGVHGVLGLRRPYRAGGHVVLRTLTDRRPVPFPEGAPPVHGEVACRGPVPDDLAEQLRLRSLQLDEALVALLDDGAEDVVAYAIDRVLRARDRGELTGPVAELARRVELRGADGLPWGSLAQWLDADPARRPALPIEAPPPPPSREEVDLGDRLREALAGVAPRVELQVDGRARSGRAWVDAGRSHAGQLVLTVRGGDPMVAAALAGPGRARELVLLELARLGVAWGRERGGRVELGGVQGRLVAQRLR